MTGTTKQIAWAKDIIAKLDQDLLAKYAYDTLIANRARLDMAKARTWCAAHGKINADALKPCVAAAIADLADAEDVINLRGEALECRIANAAANAMISAINA